MCAMAAEAMNHATPALLLADVELAEAVIAGHENTATMNSSAEETTFLSLALQPAFTVNSDEEYRPAGPRKVFAPKQD